MYFKLGQTAGYFTEDGKITHYNTFSSKITISDKKIIKEEHPNIVHLQCINGYFINI